MIVSSSCNSLDWVQFLDLVTEVAGRRLCLVVGRQDAHHQARLVVGERGSLSPGMSGSGDRGSS